MGRFCQKRLKEYTIYAWFRWSGHQSTFAGVCRYLSVQIHTP